MGWIMEGLRAYRRLPESFVLAPENLPPLKPYRARGAHPSNPLRLGLHVRLRPIKSSPYFQKEIPSFDYLWPGHLGISFFTQCSRYHMLSLHGKPFF